MTRVSLVTLLLNIVTSFIYRGCKENLDLNQLSHIIIEVKGENKIDDAVVLAKKEYAQQIASASKMEYVIVPGKQIVASVARQLTWSHFVMTGTWYASYSRI